MENNNLREPDEMFWNSPLKWIVPILYSIVIGFLIYGLKQKEKKEKENIENNINKETSIKNIKNG